MKAEEHYYRLHFSFMILLKYSSLQSVSKKCVKSKIVKIGDFESTYLHVASCNRYKLYSNRKLLISALIYILDIKKWLYLWDDIVCERWPFLCISIPVGHFITHEINCTTHVLFCFTRFDPRWDHNEFTILHACKDTLLYNESLWRWGSSVLSTFVRIFWIPESFLRAGSSSDWQDSSQDWGVLCTSPQRFSLFHRHKYQANVMHSKYFDTMALWSITRPLDSSQTEIT